MRKLIVTIIATALSFVACVALAAKVGESAPQFKAASTHGDVTLGDYADKKNVVLAFYPKDFTGG